MNKKKGFTLVELLAVIIILAIIAVIVVPVITNIINNAKKGAFRDSAYGLTKASELFYTEMLFENDIKDKTFQIVDKRFVGEGISYGGQLPGDGQLKISKKGDVSFALNNGTWCAIKFENESEISVIDYNGSNCNLDGRFLADIIFNNSHAQLFDYSITNNELKQDTIYSSLYPRLASINSDIPLDSREYLDNKKFFVSENSDNYMTINGNLYRIISISENGIMIIGKYDDSIISNAEADNSYHINLSSSVLSPVIIPRNNDIDDENVLGDFLITEYLTGTDFDESEYRTRAGYYSKLTYVDYYYTKHVYDLEGFGKEYRSWISDYAPIVIEGYNRSAASGWQYYNIIYEDGIITFGNSQDYDSSNTIYNLSYDIKYVSGDGTIDDPYIYNNDSIENETHAPDSEMCYTYSDVKELESYEVIDIEKCIDNFYFIEDPTAFCNGTDFDSYFTMDDYINSYSVEGLEDTFGSSGIFEFNFNNRGIQIDKFLCNDVSYDKNDLDINKCVEYVTKIDMFDNSTALKYCNGTNTGLNFPQGLEISEYESESDNILTYNSNNNSEMVVNIPDTINGKTVIGIGERAFEYSSLNKVNFSENIEFINELAFSNSNMKEFSLPDESKLEYIGDRAFDSTNITYIDLTNLKNLTNIGSYAFSIPMINHINLTGLNSSVNIEDRAFENDTSDYRLTCGGFSNNDISTNYQQAFNVGVNCIDTLPYLRVKNKEYISINLGTNKDILDYFDTNVDDEISCSVEHSNVTNTSQLALGYNRVVCSYYGDDEYDSDDDLYAVKNIKIVGDGLNENILAYNVKIGDYIYYNSNFYNGITCGNDENANNGWRVLNIVGENVYLIHAGYTECYTKLNYGSSPTPDVSKYMDGYYSISSRYFNSEDYIGIVGKNRSDCRDIPSRNCGAWDSIIDNGQSYWIDYGRDGGSYVWLSDIYSPKIDTILEGTYGLRPVIVLDDDLHIHSGRGDEESPYIINRNSVALTNVDRESSCFEVSEVSQYSYDVTDIATCILEIENYFGSEKDYESFCNGTMRINGYYIEETALIEHSILSGTKLSRTNSHEASFIPYEEFGEYTSIPANMITDYMCSNNTINSYSINLDACSNYMYEEDYVSSLEEGINYCNGTGTTEGYSFPYGISSYDIFYLENYANLTYTTPDNTVTDVKVPSKIDNKDITGIRSNAFMNKNITKVTIPSSINVIGENAFFENDITSITIEGNDKNRFNDNWGIIGFPEKTLEYMPIEDSCFKLNEVTKVVSYQINDINACNSFFQSVFGVEDDLTEFCNGNDDFSGLTLDIMLLDGEIPPEIFEQIELFSTFITSSTYSITDYTCTYDSVVSYTMNYNVCATYIFERFSWNATYEDALNYCNGTGNEYGDVFPKYLTSEETNYLKENANLTYTFSDKEYLNVAIPSEIDGKTITLIDEYAFYGKNIKNLHIPEGIQAIGSSAFGSNQIYELNLPESLTYLRSDAFNDNNIHKLSLPDNGMYIDSYAFYDNNLSSIIIPPTITEIGGDAFSENNIKSVIIEENETNKKTRFNSQWSYIGFPDSLMLEG